MTDTPPTDDEREGLALAIADGLGDDFDNAHSDKGEWNATRGEKGGRYRDINEPMQPDYLAASDAALAYLAPIRAREIAAAEARERARVAAWLRKWADTRFRLSDEASDAGARSYNHTRGIEAESQADAIERRAHDTGKEG